MQSAAGHMPLMGERQQWAVPAQQERQLPVQERVDRWVVRHSVGVQQDWIVVVQELEAMSVDNAGPGQTVVEYLRKKCRLETVESNQLAEEFCWITRLFAE